MSRMIPASCLPFLLLPFTLAADQLKPRDFASAETCKPCHEEIYRQWQSSFHSKSATDPVFWKLFQQAVRDTDSRASLYCLTCHAPVATATKEIPPGGEIATPLELSSIAKEGVTCDFCHTISGMEELGRNVPAGALPVPRMGTTAVKYGTHPDASTPAHLTEVSKFLVDPKFCGMCHRYAHPLPGTILQDTYSEWLYGPYRSEGRRCQDCHMPEYAGKGAAAGPRRLDLNSHVFPGGHSQMLKKAAVVSLEAELRGGPESRGVKVTVTVTNVGSGHLMPTGIPGIRELWLDVRARDSRGNEIAARQVRYGVTLLDADGKPAMPWNAVRVSKDTRLVPRKPHKSTVRLPLADSETGTIRVEGTLYYRLISKDVARAAGIEPSPPIEIARDQLLITPEDAVGRAATQ